MDRIQQQQRTRTGREIGTERVVQRIKRVVVVVWQNEVAVVRCRTCEEDDDNRNERNQQVVNAGRGEENDDDDDGNFDAKEEEEDDNNGNKRNQPNVLSIEWYINTNSPYPY